MSLRILLVLHAWPPQAAGGTGLVVGALAQALAGQGHDVFVAHPGSKSTASWHGARVMGVKIKSGLGWAAGWRGGSDQVRALMDELKPDVVDVHHLSGWPIDLPIIAKQSGARVVVTLHDYAVPCARGQLVDRSGQPCAGPGVIACTDCLSPFLGPRARMIGWPGKRDRGRVAQRLTMARSALAAADVRLAPSRDLASRIEQMGGGWVEVCPLPCTLDIKPAPETPEKHRQQQHQTSVPLRFLFCSSVIPTKGPQLLVEAFSRLPASRAQLTIAGPCPPFHADPGFADRLTRRVSAIPGARMIGDIPHSKVPDLLHAHDVLVLPSIWRENSPMIVREACAAGLRTILSDRGGGAELDPAARLVDTRESHGAVDRLYTALVAECHRGRGRRNPLQWPTADACASWLTSRAYRPTSNAIRSNTD